MSYDGPALRLSRIRGGRPVPSRSRDTSVADSRGACRRGSTSGCLARIACPECRRKRGSCEREREAPLGRRSPWPDAAHLPGVRPTVQSKRPTGRGSAIRRADRPANLLVATFTIEAEVPETMSLLAADVGSQYPRCSRSRPRAPQGPVRRRFGTRVVPGLARPRMTGTVGSRMPAGRARSEGFKVPRPSS